MDLSSMNLQCKKYHLMQESMCPKCLAKSENVKHSQCPVYAAQRAEMVTNLSHLAPSVCHLQGNVGGRNKKQLVEIMMKGTGSD